MADVTLTAERRTAGGKGPAGRIRRDGQVPAVVYGLGEQPVSVTVSARELGHILAGAGGTNTLITLKFDGSSQLTLVRQIQRHPVKRALVHVDFLRVRADIAIQAEIPVSLVGDAEGAQRGGVLEQLVHSLTVEAKPGEIPPLIEHDISALAIGDAVYVRDLAIPGGVAVMVPEDTLVAQVSAPRVSEEGAGTPAEGAEGAAAAPAEGGESGGE